MAKQPFKYYMKQTWGNRWVVINASTGLAQSIWEGRNARLEARQTLFILNFNGGK